MWRDLTLPGWGWGCGTVVWVFSPPCDTHTLHAAAYPQAPIPTHIRHNKVVTAAAAQLSQGAIFILLWVWSVPCIITFSTCHFCSLSAMAGGLVVTVSITQDTHLMVVWIFLSFMAWSSAGFLNTSPPATQQSIEIKEGIREKTAWWITMRN